MASVSFRPLQSGDIGHIAANLREADRQELLASRGEMTPADAIARAVLLSSHCWVVTAHDGEPVAIFGAAPVSLIESVGSPWFLSTERAYEYPRALVIEGRRYLSRMRETYSHLYNYVDARNDRSIRWLSRIGFKLHEPTPYGAARLPFHKFEIGTE